MNDVVIKQNCFKFYKFIEMLKTYMDEQVIRIDENGLRLNFMDMSRIMLAKVTQKVDKSWEHNGAIIKIGLNLDDFAGLLRTKKGDLKEVYIRFDENSDEIGIRKHSPKLHNDVNFTLKTIDIDPEEIPMENLEKIEYDNKASFPIKYLKDYFYNAGRLAEIVYLEIDDDGFHFKETGQCGTLDYHINYEDCNECEGHVSNAYSLNFLKPLQPILDILDNGNDIRFLLKHDHPIRIEINIRDLGIDMLIFIAPRVEEADFYDDDDDDDEF